VLLPRETSPKICQTEVRLIVQRDGVGTNCELELTIAGELVAHVNIGGGGGGRGLSPQIMSEGHDAESKK